jgi:hypothetical protein
MLDSFIANYRLPTEHELSPKRDHPQKKSPHIAAHAEAISVLALSEFSYRE